LTPAYPNREMQDAIHTNDDAEDLNRVPAFLASGKNSEPYEVPAGYFESLSDRIRDRIELEELAPVFSSILRPENPTVPAGYFKDLPGTISSSLLLHSISKTMEEAPVNYFEELPADIENSIRLSHLEISKEAPYYTEPDYFDWLPSRIQDRIVQSTRPHPALAWFRQVLKTKYLVPAGFALLLLLGIRRLYTPAFSVLPVDKMSLSENEKSNVIDNFEFLGFDDALVNEHLSTDLANMEKPTQTNNDAVEFLLENNTDLNSSALEN
jgi:hypothetical protein